ncbi:MAG: type II toxin-antitoxin system HicA family toxin [Bacteroidetes bacterium]|nr:type II toxin-antitoxin system HicA family toxin [Fibrella sp.]
MKMPRNLNGSELVKLLEKVGYQVHHQTGSHVIIKTTQNGENTQSVPNHKPLKIGTLTSILGEVADHLAMDKKALAEQLFRKK